MDRRTEVFKECGLGWESIQERRDGCDGRERGEGA